jgi:hypothetical protein
MLNLCRNQKYELLSYKIHLPKVNVQSLGFWHSSKIVSYFGMLVQYVTLVYLYFIILRKVKFFFIPIHTGKKMF